MREAQRRRRFDRHQLRDTHFTPQPVAFGHLQSQHNLKLAKESASKGGVLAMRIKLGNDAPLAGNVLLSRHYAPLALSEVLLQDAAIHGATLSRGGKCVTASERAGCCGSHWRVAGALFPFPHHPLPDTHENKSTGFCEMNCRGCRSNALCFRLSALPHDITIPERKAASPSCSQDRLPARSRTDQNSNQGGALHQSPHKEMNHGERPSEQRS